MSLKILKNKVEPSETRAICGLGSLLRHLLRIGFYGSLGVAFALVVVFVLYLNDRPDLSIWHLAELDEEFTADSEVSSFKDYLALEDRLFKQLDELVYAKIEPEQKSLINRYNRGSLSDPEQWTPNWNRSYELPVKSPRVAVLFLHGMSDSPYSLRNLAERLHKAGAYAVGLRIPGHGTAPSGLVTVTWQDMDAAVRLAMRHVAEKASGQPVYIVGYSNGGALAVNYALDALNDAALPQINGLVLLSPEIGLARVAALAIWQARLGNLLGLEKLAWNGLLPEYDPYKYGSFAVNAGDVAHRLTNEIQQSITALGANGKLQGIPPILAFSSIVDATVTAPDLIDGLFNRLPEAGHELVLFDINRMADIEPIMKWDSSKMFAALQRNPGRTFTLSLLTNKGGSSRDVMLVSKKPEESDSSDTDLGLTWPDDIYSLSHIALPFPPDDPLYGGEGGSKSPGIHLGDIALRGERGVLLVPPADILRLRWNPFYSYLEKRVLEFLELDEQ
jgi:alpha-beta hydrolase superfamily lysophospholipase